MELDQDDDAKTAAYDKRFQQFFGLFLKRFHHSRRNFKGLISQIFLPAIFVCIAMTVAMSRPGYEKQPQLILSPTMIRPLPNVIPFNNEGHSKISKRMENSLRLPSGIGADCVLKHMNSSITDIYQMLHLGPTVLQMYDGLCKSQISEIGGSLQRDMVIPTKSSNSGSSKKNNFSYNKKCRCSEDRRSYICDPGVEGNPGEISTITGEMLLNVTGRNMDQYLLYTTQHYRRHR